MEKQYKAIIDGESHAILFWSNIENEWISNLFGTKTEILVNEETKDKIINSPHFYHSAHPKYAPHPIIFQKVKEA